MMTIDQNSKAVGSSCYWGGKGDWLIVLAVHRDSGCLDRSNFEVARQWLQKVPGVIAGSGSSGLDIIRFSHWAVGWVDYLVIDPGKRELVKAAEAIKASLENYPVLDEEHFSQTEQDEAEEIWRNCYRPAERVQYIRAHRGQFEFRGFGDLLGCVRGKYFAGYASELIN